MVSDIQIIQNELLKWSAWVAGISLFYLLVGAVIRATLKKRQRREMAILEHKIESALKNIEGITGNMTITYMDGLPSKSIDLLRTLPSGSQPSINIEYEKQISKLSDEIKTLKDRFPSNESEIDKIASINDAIFLTKINSLSKTVENIEKKMLTPWDVAKIVFVIFAALAAISGVVVTVLKW